MAFEVTSGRIAVGDPSCPRGDRSVTYFAKSKNGLWYAEYEAVSFDGDLVVTVLRVCHGDHGFGDIVPWSRCESRVVVHSGHAGFFDADFFDSAPRIQQIGSRLSLPIWHPEGKRRLPFLVGIVDDQGVVSTSGHGVGTYECYYERSEDGELIEAELVFIRDSELDELFEDSRSLERAWFSAPLPGSRGSGR